MDASGVRVAVADLGTLTLPADRQRGAVTGERVKVVIRAEKLHLRGTDVTDPDTVAQAASVETVDYQGQAVRYFVRVGGRQLQAINMIDTRPFAVGETVSVHLRGRDCALLPE